MAKIIVKSYIESRLDFFKAQREKAKQKYERLSRVFEKIEAPTLEDWQKVEEVAKEYGYYIDVVILLERTPVERGNNEEL